MGWLKTNDLTEEERWLKDPLRYRRFDVTGKPSDSPPHYKQLEPAARIKRVKSLTIFTSLLFRRSREAIYLFRLARPLAIFISVLLVSDYVRAQNDIGNIGFSVEFNKSAAQQAIDRVRDIVKTVDPSWLSVPSEMHAVAQWEENASKLAVEGINFDTEIGNKCVSTTLAANSQRMGSRPQVFSTNETLAAWQGLAANLQLASQRLESNLASLQQCSDSLHRYNEQTSQLLPNLEVRLAQERARIDGELRDIKAQLVRLAADYHNHAGSNPMGMNCYTGINEYLRGETQQVEYWMQFSTCSEARQLIHTAQTRKEDLRNLESKLVQEALQSANVTGNIGEIIKEPGSVEELRNNIKRAGEAVDSIEGAAKQGDDLRKQITSFSKELDGTATKWEAAQSNLRKLIDHVAPVAQLLDPAQYIKATPPNAQSLPTAPSPPLGREMLPTTSGAVYKSVRSYRVEGNEYFCLDKDRSYIITVPRSLVDAFVDSKPDDEPNVRPLSGFFLYSRNVEGKNTLGGATFAELWLADEKWGEAEFARRRDQSAYEQSLAQYKALVETTTAKNEAALRAYENALSNASAKWAIENYALINAGREIQAPSDGGSFDSFFIALKKLTEACQR